MNYFKIHHIFFFLFLPLITGTIYAQNKSIDVQHYRFEITINDTNNIISGTAGINFIVKEAAVMVYFDLTNFNDSSGKGMKVLQVSEGNKELKFDQDSGHVKIYFNDSLIVNQEKVIQIKYRGIPADGLIISSNKFNRRTFFADNWPNRAHNWIPCNDHPADKATVDFIVTAPDHYQVIANGILKEETNLPNHLKLTHWKEDIVLPTKVMVIGIADFAVQLVENINCIPITSWVFPENRDSGFAQYAIAKNILPFYIEYIGSYPFHKLANVQSKTMFGGMENAGNIFYYENSVITGPRLWKDYISREAMFAHEIAHQWFGDEVSEKGWQHLWLSEGFATYMTHLYIEHKYGVDSLKTGMKRDRDKVIAFYKIRKTPVVDTSASKNLMELLNANSYQKGSWVLHMLRRKLGDAAFKKGIQTYYEEFKGKNASTLDFMQAMEKAGKQNLQLFFTQWLYTAGQPEIQVIWKYNPGNKSIVLSIKQKQHFLFQFPLQIAIRRNNQSVLKTIEIKNRSTSVTLPVYFEPDSILLDPGVNLLFEGAIKKEK